MKYNEIKEVIKTLSYSQGFYGRLLEQLEEIEKKYPFDFKTIKDTLESKNFKDTLDVVMYFECE